tara:strand:- start:1586 stop:1759 length:174 start_codon:yes stop_codon:yes gene_type:complete
VGCKGLRREHLVDIFREKSIVAIGWFEAGNLDNIKQRAEIIEKIKEAYPCRNWWLAY